MKVLLVMTLLGPDRPGLVDTVAQRVLEHGGNWLDSRMCHLAGEFAGILRVEVPEERHQDLVRALQGLGVEGLEVIVRPGRRQGTDPSAGRWTALHLVGQDRPGIIRQISHVLAQRGVNVHELETGCLSAPMSGETLFQADAKLWIPNECPQAELRRELEHLADDLMVDLSLQELPTPPAHASRD